MALFAQLPGQLGKKINAWCRTPTGLIGVVTQGAYSLKAMGRRIEGMSNSGGSDMRCAPRRGGAQRPSTVRQMSATREAADDHFAPHGRDMRLLPEVENAFLAGR